MTVHAYFCAGKRKDGEPCGRKVGKPGDKIRRYCWQHRETRARTTRVTAGHADDAQEESQ